MTIEALNS